MSDRRAVFVDRDGVVNSLEDDPETGLPESPLTVGVASLLPGAAGALRELHEAGFLLVCVTNQPAAAKEKTTVAALLQIQADIEAQLEAEGVAFDRVEICLHHPEGSNPELAGDCECRKPAPGMLLRAAVALEISLPESFMVGDSDSDIEAAAAAGCRSVLVTTPATAHRRSGRAAADAVARDLVAASAFILGNGGDC